MAEIKLATCCYCGRRTALRNTANGGHELACGSCGAPLHKMKALKVKPERPAKRTERPKPITRKTKRRRKHSWKKIAEKVWDELEDIFD